MLCLFPVFLLVNMPEVPFLGVPSPLFGVLPAGAGIVLNALGVLSVLAIIFLGKKARRHAQPRFAKLDAPPGVLYLRPFAQDTDYRVYASWGRDRHLPRLSVIRFQLRLWWRTLRRQEAYEFGEILAELTRDIGAVAAIGEPGSPPILGADNVYTSDDDWQQKVLAMAAEAKLVILTAGTTPGVMWETQNMLRIVPPSRLLLNIPGMTAARRRKHYAAFRDAAHGLFPRGLPSDLKVRAMAFSEDGSAIEDTARQPPPGTSAHLAWWMSRVLP